MGEAEETEKETEHPYALSIDLNVLEHLGINLYSNVPAVLAEAVANAWDADATEVAISWNEDKSEIIIQDDGHGMNRADVNNRYLTIGYSRRVGQPGLTEKFQRFPMGRKGIGKLSLFSIAEEVLVETAKSDNDKGVSKDALKMLLPDIREHVEQENKEPYHPEPLPTDGVDFEQGTRITLRALKKQQTEGTINALRRRLARRFSVLGPEHDFSVVVDQQEITPEDRDYYSKIQYLWIYGDQEQIANLATNKEIREVRQMNAGKLKITGWLGTVKESGSLKDNLVSQEGGEESEEDNLNRIAIFARGKVAQTDILSSFSERGVYASYLIGELHVDGLDTYISPDSKDEDIATSSRQQLKEDDSRYKPLRTAIEGELKHIQSRWKELREDSGTIQARQIPAVARWLDSLPKADKSKASRWIGKLNSMGVKASDQPPLIKHAIIGFEFYRSNARLDELVAIGEAEIPVVLEIFQSIEDIEMALYGEIVRERLSVIRTFQQKVEANDLEKIIQQFLFERLWLLDPSWERATENAVMESTITKMLDEETQTFTPDEKRARLDIAYQRTANQHVIIELKRPERRIGFDEIFLQVKKYRTGMSKALEEMGRPNDSVEIIVVLGDYPKEWERSQTKAADVETLAIQDARIVTYTQLLSDAHQAYRDYLEKQRDVDTLSGVIAEIGDFDPSMAE